ncbi:hypothetical protein [Ralstonia insidiosa]|uniref:Uncharacterized protein n=1 Tax=Ralstonia insidiosa TaxID=190721 RepID=A0A848P319_9RALS|nr:hypothetical protein [Ralstonia insidiosa]NMV39907.1 hypothetical protein [Ralstonia insidiosa]
MHNVFEVLWWAPYVILMIAAFPAFSCGKVVYRMILFRRDRDVAREMAKSDPAFDKVVELLNPLHLLFDALLYCAISVGMLCIAIFWARAS